jgi:hypothetical protein
MCETQPFTLLSLITILLDREKAEFLRKSAFLKSKEVLLLMKKQNNIQWSTFIYDQVRCVQFSFFINSLLGKLFCGTIHVCSH